MARVQFLVVFWGFGPGNFKFPNPWSWLKAGENLLAIQVNNASTTSSDLTAIPFLSLGTIEKPSVVRLAPALNLNNSTELHSNFKIDGDGESVYLTNPSSMLIDSVHVDGLPINATYGRSIKNPDNWAIFTEPSPNAANKGTEYSAESAGKPIFSIDGLVYSNVLKVKLTAPNPSDTIYYSLNGNVPTKQSPVYKGEITVKKSTVIKARIIKEGLLPGKTVTNSYILHRTKLPVVSLSLDSLDLWDFNTGIYVMGPNPGGYPYFGANFWQEWEKPRHFELMDTTVKRVVDANAEVKILGNRPMANVHTSKDARGATT